MNSSVGNLLLSAFGWSPDSWWNHRGGFKSVGFLAAQRAQCLSQSHVMNVEKCRFPRAPWEQRTERQELPRASRYPPTSARQSGVEARNWRIFQCRMTLFIPYFPLSICPRARSYLDPSLSHRECFYRVTGKHQSQHHSLISSYNQGQKLWCKL